MLFILSTFIYSEVLVVLPTARSCLQLSYHHWRLISVGTL